MKTRLVFILLILFGSLSVQAAPPHRLKGRPARRSSETVNLVPRVPVILVNFSDKSFSATNTASAFDSLFNGDVYTYNNAYGSVRKYFSDQSSGQYEPVFDVYGPLTLSQNVAYYGTNDSQEQDQHATDMIIEACLAADSAYDVDFSQYDNDKDGYADIIYVIYAGRNEADGGSENTIWPHYWNVQDYIGSTSCTYNQRQTLLDDVFINFYCCNSELISTGSNTSSTRRITIGAICHNISYTIGLPALYDTNYGTNYSNRLTPDAWDIMDYGSYNGDGNYPPNFSVWEKAYLGWTTPVNLGTTPQPLTLFANGSNNYQAYYVNSEGTEQTPTTAGLCYYLENRQQTGWDTYLPGHGLLIWLVNYNQSAWAQNAVNSTAGSPRLTVVSATGSTKNIGSATDPFPGTRNVTSWSGISDRPLTDIAESNNVITCTYISQPDTVIEPDTTVVVPDTTVIVPDTTVVEPDTIPEEEIIELSINLPERQWTFVMFPEEVCEVQMSPESFELGYNTYWGTYDGELRSTNEPGWVFYNEPLLDCSHAYIVYTEEPTQIMLTLPGSVREVKDITLPVSHFPAEYALNDSWNFIGNPYIYPYDISGLAAERIKAKIAVWNGAGYDFYTPGVDDYVLEPLQPFFIQLPEDAADAVTFRARYVITQ